MEKVKLNNQIVLMRKYVKQAKVHTINKLVKQMKLLQNRKGNEIQVQKAKRKAEKFLEEISILKKIKPDSISKVALSKDKDWKELLLQKSCTIEDRCIAMLASYGPVQKEVEIFHNSNKDLVAKISDLIKQWEEKDKFHKKSPKKKFDLNKQNNTSMQKIRVAEGLLNDVRNQSATTDNRNNKSVDEKTESSFLIDNNHELKSQKRKLKGARKQNQSSIEPSENSLHIGKISELSDNSEGTEKNAMEIEESNNVENKSRNMLDDDNENESENDTDSDADNQSKDECESNDGIDIDSDAENESKDECESNDENESNIASDGEENDDFKHKDIHENELKRKGDKIRGNVFKKLQLSKGLEFNSDKSPNEKSSIVSDTKNLNTSLLKADCTGFKRDENKLKAIAVLNLDDLRDFDEIPVNNSVENGESDEEEKGTDEHSINDASQNDPFFLGRDEAVSAENRLVDNPMNSGFVSKDQIFTRKEKSVNESKYKKNFNKPLNRSQFSSRNSYDYKEDRNSKTFKKDKFMPKSDRGRFQDKSKNSYDQKNFKNRFEPYKQKNFDGVNSSNSKAFKRKTFSETYGNNNKYNNSNDLYCRNRGDNSLGKSKRLHQKDDLNIKPLHPSWEAKRKEKKLMNTSFQGKKVVFED